MLFMIIVSFFPMMEYETEGLAMHVEVVEEKPDPDHNVRLLAQIVHAEAKGESYEGKVAVAEVVLNRVDSPNFPDTIEEVIFQKGQFQPVRNGTIYNEPSEEAWKAARQALTSRNNDGSLYFYNPQIATDGWIQTRETVKVIGNHVFAK